VRALSFVSYSKGGVAAHSWLPQPVIDDAVGCCLVLFRLRIAVDSERRS